MVGYANRATGDWRAFVWTENLGMTDLNTLLPTLGVDMTGWVLTSANDISDDGTTIVGEATYLGSPRAFRISGLSLLAPTTTISVSPAANAAGWHSGDVNVNLAATGGSGGVREIRYTIDMGPEQVVAGNAASLTLSTEGIHTVSAWAVDNSGNVETTRFATVKIDKTAATTSATQSPVANAAGWTKAATSLALAATDTVSGVHSVRHKVGANAEQTTAGASASLSFSTSGVHTVEFKSVDNAGNVELTQTREIKVDLAAPTVSGVVANSVLTLSASDSHSGIARIRYQIDNAPAQTYSSAVSLSPAAKKVVFWSEDNAGNSSVSQTIPLGTSVNAITVSPSTLYAGATVTVKLALSSPAPSGGLSVSLQSSAPSVFPVPSSVNVSAGGQSATFTSVLGPVATDTSLNLTATAGGITTSKGVVVLVPVPKSVTFSPSVATGGNSVSGTITLVSKAPAGGLSVTLTSFDPGTLTVPGNVVVPAGATTVKFPATTSAVSSAKSVLVRAEADDTGVLGVLSLRPVGLAKLQLTPSSVSGGGFSVGRLTLTRPAPSGGLTVALVSSLPSVVVPTSVTVPAGATTVQFSIATSPVSVDSAASVQARHDKSTLRAVLTVLAPRLVGLRVSPSTIAAGANATGTVSLDSAAPTGGVVVVLSSGAASLSIPPSVTIPAGSASADFVLSAGSVATETSVVVGAQAGANFRTTTVTVRP